jgi:hypothetical protein
MVGLSGSCNNCGHFVLSVGFQFGCAGDVKDDVSGKPIDLALGGEDNGTKTTTLTLLHSVDNFVAGHSLHLFVND